LQKGEAAILLGEKEREEKQKYEKRRSCLLTSRIADGGKKPE